GVPTITLSLVLVATVGAQQPASPDPGRPLTVRVVEDSTLQPLPNAEVAVPALGRRYLTNSRGEIRLSRPADGSLVIRVRQIGFRPVTRELAAVPGDTVVVRLARVAYELPRVVTTADRGCDDAPDPASAALSARVLEQLRFSAERYELFRREYPFEVEFGRRSAYADARSDTMRVRDEEERTNSDAWREPYRPGRVLRRGAREFSVPILFLSTLADSTFWAHHCFSAPGVEWRDGEPLILLQFSPTSRIRTPDWAGVALLDSATSALRRIEFQLTGLKRGNRPRRLEGYTTFAAPSPFIVVPDPTVAVWWMREPPPDGDWGLPDVGQMLYTRTMKWRKAEPPPTSRTKTP
ncbi:MAG: carboxypeptidase-like regulatory domain-containing protein, partial [Gemmatimonadaceae bacterium]|nr:carboxypeptidase-like regulatory domain-containing protein [Gemmatimonadaceae bacterium]